MKLISFEFSDPTKSQLVMNSLLFNSQINLMVGESGSGKTRLFNMIFNTASMAVGGRGISTGKWKMVFSHDEKTYTWLFEAEEIDENSESKAAITYECLYSGTKENAESKIFERTLTNNTFNGTSAPKISSNLSGINVYKDESSIKNAFNGLTQIKRRTFSGSDLVLAVTISAYPKGIIQKFQDKKLFAHSLYEHEFNLHTNLYLLHKFCKKTFQEILNQYKFVFPFVEDIIVASSNSVMPHIGVDGAVVLIKEKHVSKATPLTDISSGMIKVLLIITDILTSPKSSLYMIDEYENSLGMNAINFLPSFLSEFCEERQFLITTHHPALINGIKTNDWIVFTRKGSTISTTKGAILMDRYSKSKQERYLQLINDPEFKIQ